MDADTSHFSAADQSHKFEDLLILFLTLTMNDGHVGYLVEYGEMMKTSANPDEMLPDGDISRQFG
jgi:hypothetical protein